MIVEEAASLHNQRTSHRIDGRSVVAVCVSEGEVLNLGPRFAAKQQPPRSFSVQNRLLGGSRPTQRQVFLGDEEFLGIRPRDDLDGISRGRRVDGVLDRRVRSCFAIDHQDCRTGDPRDDRGKEQRNERPPDPDRKASRAYRPS